MTCSSTESLNDYSRSRLAVNRSSATGPQRFLNISCFSFRPPPKKIILQRWGGWFYLTAYFVIQSAPNNSVHFTWWEDWTVFLRHFGDFEVFVQRVCRKKEKNKTAPREFWSLKKQRCTQDFVLSILNWKDRNIRITLRETHTRTNCPSLKRVDTWLWVFVQKLAHFHCQVHNEAVERPKQLAVGSAKTLSDWRGGRPGTGCKDSTNLNELKDSLEPLERWDFEQLCFYTGNRPSAEL